MQYKGISYLLYTIKENLENKIQNTKRAVFTIEIKNAAWYKSMYIDLWKALVAISEMMDFGGHIKITSSLKEEF